MLLPRKRNRNRRPTLDVLENRTVLTVASPIFVVDGGSLYLDFQGDALNEQVLLGRTSTGDLIYRAASDYIVDGIFDDWEVDTQGTVSAGEIANASQQVGNVPFRGVRVFGNDGNDILSGAGTLPGSVGPMTVSGQFFGGAGNDVLTGGFGVDSYSGGAGNDTINADRRDTIGAGTGGTGNDTLNISSVIPLPTFTVINTDIETVNGSSLAETVDNSGFNDTSTANAMSIVSITVLGNDGNDTIISGPATIGAFTLRETLNGGGGLDTISYAASNAAVTVNLNNNTASGGYATGDTISNFENVTGSSFDDTLTGSGVANVINGGAGADTIYGLAGDDTINAGDGDDYVEGGAGNDTINGGAGNDELQGQAGDDTINGGLGDDLLLGGNGNDTLNGNEGVNALYGQAGNDTLFILWSEVAALVASPGANTGSVYFGGAGADDFQIYNTPAAVTNTVFSNTVSDYFNINNVIYGYTDYAVPDTFTRNPLV